MTEHSISAQRRAIFDEAEALAEFVAREDRTFTIEESDRLVALLKQLTSIDRRQRLLLPAMQAPQRRRLFTEVVERGARLNARIAEMERSHG